MLISLFDIQNSVFDIYSVSLNGISCRCQQFRLSRLPADYSRFTCRAPMVLTKLTCGSYHPMAWNTKGHRFIATRAPNCGGGLGRADPACNGRVSAQSAQWYLQQGIPNFKLKIGTLQVQLDVG